LERKIAFFEKSLKDSEIVSEEIDIYIKRKKADTEREEDNSSEITLRIGNDIEGVAGDDDTDTTKEDAEAKKIVEDIKGKVQEMKDNITAGAEVNSSDFAGILFLYENLSIKHNFIGIKLRKRISQLIAENIDLNDKRVILGEENRKFRMELEESEKNLNISREIIQKITGGEDETLLKIWINDKQSEGVDEGKVRDYIEAKKNYHPLTQKISRLEKEKEESEKIFNTIKERLPNLLEENGNKLTVNEKEANSYSKARDNLPKLREKNSKLTKIIENNAEALTDVSEVLPDILNFSKGDDDIVFGT
jgi:hypothetical protein